MATPGRPHKSDPRVDSMTTDIEKGDNEKVTKLLTEVGVDSCDSYLRTALIWSAFYGNASLLKWLIHNGANINQQDKNGYCALHFAGQEKRADIASILLDNGADLEIVDAHGNTPLWTAVFNAKGNATVANLYIQKGADLDHVNKHQRTPRQMAETFGGFNLKK